MSLFIDHNHQAPGHDDERVDRWMVSYADFVTLLFVLFLALYALSIKQAQKDKPVESVTAAKMDSAGNAIRKVNLQSTGELDYINHTLSGFLSRQGLTHLVALRQTDGRLSIDLPEYLLFAPATATLAPEALPLIDVLAYVLHPLKAKVIVEGHTDNQPIQTAAFPSNWELSAARAASVVRRLEDRGLDRTRLFPTGRADADPIANNTTSEGRAANRRVTFQIEERI